MSLFACNGSSGYYGALTGNVEKSVELAHVKATRATLCNVTASSIDANSVTAGSAYIESASAGELLFEGKAAPALAPTDCNVGLFYALAGSGLPNSAPYGPYDHVLPTFQDCAVVHTLGNVASETDAPFIETGAIIVSAAATEHPSGHLVKESRIGINGTELRAINDELVRLRTADDIVFDARALNVNSNDVTLSGSSIYLNNGYSNAIAEIGGGIVVNSKTTGTYAAISSSGFVGASSPPPTYGTQYIIVCGDQTATFYANDFIQVSDTPNDMNTGLYQLRSVEYKGPSSDTSYLYIEDDPSLVEHFVQTTLRTHTYSTAATAAVTSGFTTSPCGAGVVRGVLISYFGTESDLPDQLVFKRGSNATTMTSISYFTLVEAANADVQVVPIADGYQVGIARPTGAPDGTLIIGGETAYPGVGATTTQTVVIGGGDINNPLQLTNTNGNTSIGYNAGRSPSSESNVAIGVGAGRQLQGGIQGRSVAIGSGAGAVSQNQFAVAIGSAAATNSQGDSSVAIGQGAANDIQGNYAIAIGNNTANTEQGDHGIAIGSGAAFWNQGDGAIAIGLDAGRGVEATSFQGALSIAIGTGAAITTQGQNSVAIGAAAGGGAQAGQCVAVGAQSAPLQGQNAIAIGYRAAYDALNSQPPSSVAIGPECPLPSEPSVLAFGLLKTVYTSAVAGTAAAPPATPQAYMPVEYNGVSYCIPLYLPPPPP